MTRKTAHTPRILIVSFHFYPGNAIGARRPSELALFLRESGYRVTVLAGPEPAVIDASAAERIRGIEIVRVPLPARRRGGFTWRSRAGGGNGRSKSSPSGGQTEPPVKGPTSASSEDQAGELQGAAGSEAFVDRLRRYWHSITWVNDDKKGWAWAALPYLRRLAREGAFDVIVSSGPPMSPHVAVWLSGLPRSAPWVMDYRDPWYPTVSWVREVQSPIKDWIETQLEARCLQQASAVVSATDGITRAIKRYPVAPNAGYAVTITNGYDGPANPVDPPVGRLALLYAGTLYFNRDPRPLMRCLGELCKQMNPAADALSLTIVGDVSGFAGVDLPGLARQLGIGEVLRLVAPVSRAELQQYYDDSNVLVNFAQGQPLQVPGKMFEYIAQRREILVYAEADGATGELAAAVPWCHLCDPERPSVTLDILKSLYDQYVLQRRPGHFIDDIVGRYSRARTLEQYEQKLRSLMPAGRLPGSA